MLLVCEYVCQKHLVLTIAIQFDLVEALSTGLLANVFVHFLRTHIIQSQAIVDRLTAWLNGEWDIHIPYCEPVQRKMQHGCQWPHFGETCSMS